MVKRPVTSLGLMCGWLLLQPVAAVGQSDAARANEFQGRGSAHATLATLATLANLANFATLATLSAAGRFGDRYFRPQLEHQGRRLLRGARAEP